MIYNQNMIVYSIHNSWAVVFLGVFDYFQLFSVKTAKIGCYDRSVLFVKKKSIFFLKKHRPHSILSHFDILQKFIQKISSDPKIHLRLPNNTNDCHILTQKQAQ